jgi:hypothetical protein
MGKPPFLAASITKLFQAAGGSEMREQAAEVAHARRLRLEDLDPHFHCSIIGTCMSTAAMRKLMRRLDATH